MPSLNALGTALLACAGSAVATQFTLSETYDHTNFFDKFTFFDDADTNSGFVVYENQANAMAQGLAKITSNNEVYLGVDHTTKLKGSGFAGRSSIRLESKDSYTHGLIVARFTHLPANKCGSWPSFWTLGDNWPNGGEIDVYEGWNNIVDNQPAFHVGSSALYGECTLANAGQSSPVATSNCDNTFQSPPSQYLNQGCTATDSTGPWASANGGTYAIEWTSDYIKLYNWARGAEPANLATSQPDTATWGTPVVNLQNSNCNIDRHFGSQRMILDIDFCGNPVGTPAYWQQSCSKTTGQATCADYVSNFPGDFAQTFFQIEDIRYFSQSTSKPTSSSAVHSSTKASSSVVHSSTKASSSVVHSTSSAAHSTVKASSSPAGASSPVVVPTSVIQSQSAATPTISFSDSSSAAAVTGHPTSKWTNSSITVTSAAQMTTSTVYTTSLRTITQCPPEVTNCPTRPKTVTDTIALYTTICPVLAAESSSAALAAESTASPSAPAVSAYVPPSGPETITTEITRVHTITSCAPEVTNCPARLSTEIIRTSYPAGQPTGVPVAPSAPAYPAPPAGSGPQESSPAAGYPVPSSPAGAPAPVETVPVAPVGAPSSVPVVPVAPVAPVGAPSSVPVAPAAPIDTPTNIPVGPGSVPMNGTWSTTVVSKPSSVPQGGAAPSVQPPVPVSSGLGSAGCTGTDCLPPVGSGAVRTGMSTLALVGAMVAMLL